MEKLRVIELFAGIGAWSKGLERLQIPHEVVRAVEFDPRTIKSYNLIHGTNFEPIDITQLDEKQLPDCDVICYSPPCQAFSVAGKQLGFDDKRGVLFFDAYRIIKEKMPKYAFMENVKGLTGKKFKDEFGLMLRLLEDLGYRNYYQVINAKEYIPQNRERVFIVSVRNDIKVNFEFPSGQNNKRRFVDLLEPLVDEKYYINDSNASKFIEKYLQENTLPNNTYTPVTFNRKVGISKPIEIAHSLNSSDWRGLNRNQDQNAIIVQKNRGEWKEKKDGIVSCIDANYHKGIDNHAARSAILQHYRIRKLTPLECFRLMGFDDQDYYILKENKVSDTQLYKMAGNSIVVDVPQIAIFSQLFLNGVSSQIKGTMLKCI